MRPTRTLLLTAFASTALVIAAACSSSGGGSSADPYVHLYVTDGYRNPASAVPVVVWDSAGTIVTQLASDSSGNAAVLVPPGGTFGVFGYGFGHSVTRVLGAPAGGHVRLDSVIPGPTPAATPTPPAPTTVTVTLTNSPVGTVQYEILTDCTSAGGGPGNTFTGLSAACTGQSTFDTWAVAYDANGLALGFGNVLAQPAMPGGAVGLTFAVNRVNFDATTLHGYLNSGPATVSASIKLLAGYMDATKFSNAPFGPPVNVVLHYLPGLMLPHQATALESTGGISWFMSRTTAVATSASFDFSGITPPTVSAVDTSLHAHPRITWSLPGGYGEAVSADILWTDSHGPQFWTLLAPGSYSGSLTVPNVPASLSAWTVTASATVFSGQVTYQNDLPGTPYQVYLSDGLEGGSSWFQQVSVNSP